MMMGKISLKTERSVEDDAKGALSAVDGLA
jgi:hypothetical protein